MKRESWIVAIAIAAALAKRLTVKPSSVVGIVARNLTAFSASAIGTVIGSILFKGSVLSLGSMIVSVIIAGLLILLFIESK